MQFVAPNAVPRLKRNFAAALDRMFFFDDKIDQSRLSSTGWPLLCTEVRAASFIFDGTIFKTGHVQGQATSSKYYPANLGAMVETTDNNSYSSSGAGNVSIPTAMPNNIADFLCFDFDSTDYQHYPLGINPRKLNGWGGNGWSAPDTRILYAMKAITALSTTYGKLETPFSKSNVNYSSGGGSNTIARRYIGRFGTRTYKPSDNGIGFSVTPSGTSLAGVTDPAINPLLSGANAAQLFSVERTEYNSYQQIYAPGSGAGPLGEYNYYNYRNIIANWTADNVTFSPDATKGIYYPISGTPETPNLTWGAVCMKWMDQKVFLKLSEADLNSAQVTPGQSVQMTAKQAINAPIVNKQIYMF